MGTLIASIQEITMLLLALLLQVRRAIEEVLEIFISLLEAEFQAKLKGSDTIIKTAILPPILHNKAVEMTIAQEGDKIKRFLNLAIFINSGV